MFRPYVARIVSRRRKVGKTSLGTVVARKLVELGYRVSVIKHAGHRFDLEDKDSARYLSTGVEKVVASSHDVLAIYIPRHVDDLARVLGFIDTPIVIVEGFTRSNIGDAIAVIGDVEDLEYAKQIPNLIAIVTHTEDLLNKAIGLGVEAMNINNAAHVASIIVERAKRWIYEQLPKTNCGMCGYSGCIEFAEAYLRGETYTCPSIAEIMLKINGKPIPMNPFVKNLLRGIIDGFVKTLKNVPKDYKHIEITIEF